MVFQIGLVLARELYVAVCAPSSINIFLQSPVEHYHFIELLMNCTSSDPPLLWCQVPRHCRTDCRGGDWRRQDRWSLPLGRGMSRCCYWLTSPGALALTIMVELAVLGDGVPDALTVMPGELCWWCGVRDRPRGRVEPWGFLEPVGVNVRGSSWPWHLKYWHGQDVCKYQDRWYNSFEYCSVCFQ